MACAGGAVCIGGQAIALPASGSIDNQLVGLLCAIGALAAWSAYAVGNSRCLVRLKQVSVHDWNLLTGAVTGAQALVLIPVAAIAGPVHHEAQAWFQFTGVSIGLAVLASMLGNALWNQMGRMLPLTMVGQMILFETLFALIYGFVWEQRLPQPLEVVAFAFVVASVISSISAHRRHASIEAPR